MINSFICTIDFNSRTRHLPPNVNFAVDFLSEQTQNYVLSKDDKEALDFQTKCSITKILKIDNLKHEEDI